MSLISKNSLIESRVDTAYRWYHYNPILPPNTIGFVSGTSKYKIGDGITKWNDLKYITGKDLEFIINDNLIDDGIPLVPKLIGFEGVTYDICLGQYIQRGDIINLYFIIKFNIDVSANDDLDDTFVVDFGNMPKFNTYELKHMYIGSSIIDGFGNINPNNSFKFVTDPFTKNHNMISIKSKSIFFQDEYVKTLSLKDIDSQPIVISGFLTYIANENPNVYRANLNNIDFDVIKEASYIMYSTYKDICCVQFHIEFYKEDFDYDNAKLEYTSEDDDMVIGDSEGNIIISNPDQEIIFLIKDLNVISSENIILYIPEEIPLPARSAEGVLVDNNTNTLITSDNFELIKRDQTEYNKYINGNFYSVGLNNIGPNRIYIDREKREMYFLTNSYQYDNVFNALNYKDINQKKSSISGTILYNVL